MFGKKPNARSKSELRSLIEQREQRLANVQHAFQFELERYKASRCQHWEYNQVVDPSPEQLFNMGQLGWELVAVATYAITTQRPTPVTLGTDTTYHRYVFKRPFVYVPPEVEADIRRAFPELDQIPYELGELQLQLANY